MQVNIVTAKTGCDLTIAELAKRPFIGLLDGNAGNKVKYMLVACPSGYTFAYVSRSTGFYSGAGTVEKLLRNMDTGGTFHVFPTAGELYTWMAE